jgi:hypothetical protein
MCYAASAGSRGQQYVCNARCCACLLSGLLTYTGQDRNFKYTLQDPTQYGAIDGCDFKLKSDTSQYSTQTAYMYVGEYACTCDAAVASAVAAAVG